MRWQWPPRPTLGLCPLPTRIASRPCHSEQEVPASVEHMFDMENRTVRLEGGPYDGRETTASDQSAEFCAYLNMYGNVMTTKPGGMPGTDSMVVYHRLLMDDDVAFFIEPEPGE